MKVALVIAAFCIVACLGENATDTRQKRQTKGRFLSLPVPQKCATRKFRFNNKINLLYFGVFIAKFSQMEKSHLNCFTLCLWIDF